MKTTVLIKVYVDTSLVSVLVIVIYIWLCSNYEKGWIADVALGIGCGVFSSTVLAFIIDLANTKRQQDEYNKVFLRLKAGFDSACEELLTEFVVAVQEVYGIDDNKRTFIEWAKMLLENNFAKKELLNEADYALQQITEIERQAKKLLGDSRIHINNPYLNADFTKKIEKVLNICQRIDREHRRNNYENCLTILSKEMVKAMVEYDHSLSSCFETPVDLGDK